MINLQMGFKWTGSLPSVHLPFPTAIMPIDSGLEDMASPTTIMLLPWDIKQIKQTTWQMVPWLDYTSLELCH